MIEFATFATERAGLDLFSNLLGYSPGLAELLAWLDAREAEYDVATEHEIEAPALGYHGRAARLLRFFQAQWAKRGQELEELRAATRTTTMLIRFTHSSVPKGKHDG